MNKIYTSVVILLCLSVPILGLAQTSEQSIDLNAKCELLEDLRIKDTNILSASIVPADGDLPEYCRVLGYIRPAINFEIRLPTKSWNGKFFMAGCRGFCGSVNIYDTDKAFKRNYAVSAMDGGHWGESAFDLRWAYNNRPAEIDWAYRAVHETVVVTKKMIEAFYDRKVNQSYFRGCSGAGRQAVMAAWKYPMDFDGVISGMPSFDIPGLSANYNHIIQSNIGHDGKEKITVADLALITKAVYEACDDVDGLKDGLIEIPGDCKFDPATLLCSENNTTDCLTAEQVETLKLWYEGPRNSAGEHLYPGGLPLGSEPFWHGWITGKTDDINDSWSGLLCIEILCYLAFQEDPGDTYSIMDFDFDSDPQQMKFMAQIINADHPDLEAYRNRGGKLLMYQSWAAPVATPWKTIDFYEEIERSVGDRETTQDFFRLFMIPGMDHCGIGEGPGIDKRDGFDPLTALENWVEKGESPESILTTKYDDDRNVLWTRPVCPYPQRPIYKGQGDIHDAANYSCAEQ